MSWVSEELSAADLGDVRRNRRLIRVVEDLAAQPHASVPQASRDAAALQGLYEFWSNRRVDADSIIAAHAAKSVERISRHSTVLAIQDTTDLDYSPHRSTQGLGGISKEKARGLRVHSVLAASSAGVPLGVLHQNVWSRSLTARTPARRASIAEKESGRWLTSLEVTQQMVPPTTRVITVADREGDIYELFAHPRRENSEFLIRAAQNRNTKSDPSTAEVQPLFAAVRQTPCRAEQTLSLQRTPRRAARQVQLSLRYTRLWLQPPASLPHLAPIAITVLLAEETSPPGKASPIQWLLLTTIDIADVATAQQCLKWYACRWLIERYHYVLKSGCRLEWLQLRRADRLIRALACYAIVAWRLLWLSYSARADPDTPIADIFNGSEWRSLYCLVHQTSLPPARAPSLGECVQWIAHLGGGLGRVPGLQSLWRGWQRLQDTVTIWQLLTAEGTSSLSLLG